MAAETVLEALRSGLAAAMPARQVSRRFRAMGELSAAALAAGDVAIVCRGEKDFANYNGREAQLGTLEVMLVGRLQVGDEDGLAVEQAELALAGEVKAFVATRPWPAGIDDIRFLRVRQSGQLEAPFGWVVMDLEVA